MKDAIELADQLIDDHIQKRPFSVTSLDIIEENRQFWVRIKSDPEAFRKRMFDGDWAFSDRHPEVGSLRVLRVLTGHDGVTRAIARQGDFLYAYPLV